MDNLLAFISALPILLLALILRRIFGSYLAPGSFFALYWSLAVILPILATPQEYCSPGAILYIFTATLFLSFGSLLGMRQFTGKHRLQLPFFSNYKIKWFVLGAVISTVLGFSSVIITLNEIGVSVSNMLSFAEFIALANWFSVARYEQAYTPNIFSQILRVFVYLAPLLGGSLIGISNTRQNRTICIITLLPALLITLLQTQRGATIIGVVFLLSTYASLRIVRGEHIVINFRRIISISLGGVVLFLLFTIAALFRSGKSGADNLIELIPKVYSHFFGHLTAFSLWFDGLQWTPHEWGLGRYLFAGIFNALGEQTREIGLFTEMIWLDSGYQTNIYTIFRVLIEDFGWIVCWFILLAVGFVSSKLYARVRSGQIIFVPLLSAYYAFVIMSFSTSLFVWNTVIIAFVLFEVLICVIYGALGKSILSYRCV